MILKSINIHRWNANNPLNGSVEFFGAKGEIKIHLTEEMAKRIVTVCAEQMVESTKEVSRMMAAELINALPSPSDAA